MAVPQTISCGLNQLWPDDEFIYHVSYRKNGKKLMWIKLNGIIGRTVTKVGIFSSVKMNGQYQADSTTLANYYASYLEQNSFNLSNQSMINQQYCINEDGDSGGVKQC